MRQPDIGERLINVSRDGGFLGIGEALVSESRPSANLG